MEVPEKKTSRTFSKRMLIINVALTWAAIYLAIYMGSVEGIVVAGFGLIGALYSAYTGIGHLDFRKIIDTARDAALSNGSTEETDQNNDEIG